MMEYWNDVKKRRKSSYTQHSIIPWPRPGFYMAPVIILVSRQGGPTFHYSNWGEAPKFTFALSIRGCPVYVKFKR